MPFNAATWRNDSGKAFHGRSADLQQIDAALRQYEQGKSGHTLKALARAILAWQATKVPWMSSIRRDAMIQLINYVKAEAAVRAPEAGGYIFSFVKCEPDLQQLVANPRVFLGRRPLAVAGAAGDGLATFRLKWATGDGTFENDPILLTTLFPGAEVYSLSGDNQGPSVQAISIMMHTDVNAHTTADNIRGKLHVLAGSHFMTTGQLSGCSFVVRSHGGQIACTHIKPNGFGGNGVPLQDHLETLDLGGEVAIYGRNDYPNGDAEVRVAIVGRRDVDGWEIYAQRFLHRTSTVLGVDRIWPR